MSCSSSSLSSFSPCSDVGDFPVSVPADTEIAAPSGGVVLVVVEVEVLEVAASEEEDLAAVVAVLGVAVPLGVGRTNLNLKFKNYEHDKV